MKLIFFIGAGGAVGAIARYYLTMLVNQWSTSHAYSYLPGTLMVNVLGSFLMGVAFALFSQQLIQSENLRLFIIVGMLGAFTTFSTFSLETLLYLHNGQLMLAVVNVLLSVVLSLAAVVIGFYAFKMLIS